MSCISSNFSSFFLDSLNDPSEFAKYLSNGENKVQSFDDFQGYSSNGSYSNSSASHGDSPMYVNGENHHHPIHHQQQQHHQHQQQQSLGNQQIYSGVGSHNHHGYGHHQHHLQHQQAHPVQQNNSPQTFPTASRWNTNSQNHTPASGNTTVSGHALADHHHHHPHHNHHHQQHHHPHHQHSAQPNNTPTPTTQPLQSHQHQQQQQPHHHNSQHFDGSFEFLKYLRHSGDYGEDSQHSNSTTPIPNAAPTSCSSSSNSNLIDLDSSTSMTPHSHRTGTPLAVAAANATPLNRSSLDIDTFDHDSKHNLFDLQHQTSNNSNESSCDPMGAFAGVHLNASNSNISSESAGSDNSNNNNNNNQSNASKPLVNFSIKETFDVHPAHKVEEGIFQHMNKLPVKKKDTLKQLGVRFTGQMTLADKSIVVENFIKFCKQYDVTDHRPFLALNQSGMNKPEQIKFARYLGQGLPSFTLFCIYSNFKNLFCTKRTETYEKDGYNLQYILDKTKSFLSKATADLKSLTTTSASNDGLEFPTNNGSSNNSSSSVVATKSEMPKVLERLVFHENFDVHETHRIEDGVCTHIARLPPKKQELLKQFGIQSNQSVTYYEKYIVIENFIKFCNEYKITDHRPFLDFHESGLPKSEQLKFVRYLGQGLPNLTLNKIYLAFKDVLGLNRIEKITADGYNLDVILKKKKKNLYNRMHAAVHRESTEASKQAHRESIAS